MIQSFREWLEESEIVNEGNETLLDKAIKKLKTKKNNYDAVKVFLDEIYDSIKNCCDDVYGHETLYKIVTFDYLKYNLGDRTVKKLLQNEVISNKDSFFIVDDDVLRNGQPAEDAVTGYSCKDIVEIMIIPQIEKAMKNQKFKDIFSTFSEDYEVQIKRFLK